MNYPCVSTEFISFRVVLFEWKKGTYKVIIFPFLYINKGLQKYLTQKSVIYFVIIFSL